MRIALLILHADPRRGGAEQYTFDLARRLVARDHDVSLLALPGDIDMPPGVTRVELGGGGLTRIGAYRDFVGDLRKHLEESSYDVRHAMLPVPEGLCDVYHPHAGVEARRGTSGLEGLRLQLVNPRRKRFAEVERSLLSSRQPPMTIALSNRVEQALRQHHPRLPASRIVCIPNGVDLDTFRPDGQAADPASLRLPDEARVLLHVSNNFGLKGLSPLLRAVAKLPDDVHLLVVGEDRSRVAAGIRSTARPLGNRVQFLGRRSDLPALYRLAKLTVQPSNGDSCSLATLEALASGTPVVGSAADGATDVLEGSKAGIVLQDPRDVSAIAKAVESLLEPTRYTTAAQACHDLRRTLGVQTHVDRVEAVYRQVTRAAT